ncbi:MAG: hypothetical protein AVDCRST_MAG95-2801 [uncultured Adhaeribacter sp.]|uniref:Outer membrane protein beta-barrel domain-containing protein n=1 Tax=uncultured Adhaeribacter sp. TaxID=448109 RepID=A0A6J4JB10_9BACT|nr:MAG: hypothetical protein AVDCRST_MAG95-2801 [uncultured Adhaeribacter sp.]
MKLIGGIFLILFWSSVTGFGQIKKGTFLLGGTLGLAKNMVPNNTFPSPQFTDEREKSFIAGPQAALFIADNIAVGLSVNYEHTKIRRFDAMQNIYDPIRTQTLSLGPLVRYYHFLNADFAVFGQAKALYSEDFNHRDYNQFTAALAPGLVYFVTPKIGLELNIGGLTYEYAYSKRPDDYTFTFHNVDLRLLNGLQTGISFYLGR